MKNRRLNDSVLEVHMDYIKDRLDNLYLKIGNIETDINDLKSNYLYLEKQIDTQNHASKWQYPLSGFGGFIGGFIAIISKTVLFN